METRLTVVPPQTILGSPDKERRMISHYPRLEKPEAVQPISPSAVEKILTEWFGSPTVLLASGRTGLHLHLRAKGFDRYRHKLAIPPYLSRCVINALTPSVFPVELPNEGDGMLLYHQYGFLQRCCPKNKGVIEDIAHAFFASPSSGARDWAGEVAVFSLPKFFAIAGMAGGLVIRNAEIAGKIREMIDRAPPEPSGIREWMRQVIASAYRHNPADPRLLLVAAAYELLLSFYLPDARDLAGFPGSIAEICRMGEQRHKRVVFYRSFFGEEAVPPDFWNNDEELLPFALPYFGSGDERRLQRANRALEEQGVVAGVYHVDVNRNMYEPDYKPCLLLPCHQDIAMEDFEGICRTVRDYDR